MGRKYKALQGNVIKHFVFLCLSPLQKAMENILENAFSSVLEGHNFKFSHPSAPTMGSLWESLNITYLTVCNSIQQYAQKILGYSTVTILVHDVINLLYYSQGISNSQIFHGKCSFPNFAICRTSQFMFSKYLQSIKIWK